VRALSGGTIEFKEKSAELFAFLLAWTSQQQLSVELATMTSASSK
jgi:hypothetical protein